MSDFTMTRRISTTASPDRVLALVDDFREWVRWSPWEGLDANLNRTYAGPATGAGSSYSWSGNKKAGVGTMTMTGAGPDGVDIDLVFTAPFPAKNHVRIDTTPASGGGTDIAWTMSGEQSLMTKIFFAVMRMEGKLAADFDRGLAQLKAVAESA